VQQLALTQAMIGAKPGNTQPGPSGRGAESLLLGASLPVSWTPVSLSLDVASCGPPASPAPGNAVSELEQPGAANAASRDETPSASSHHPRFMRASLKARDYPAAGGMWVVGVYDAAVGNIGIAELLLLGVIGLIPLAAATAVVVLVVVRGRRDEERGAPRR
jgi:hypothetical protein